MAQGNPLPGEKYLHFKNKLYQVIAVAKHSETMEPYVVYQALYGDFGVYIRPYDMFISEVDHEKYPEVKQKYRFAYVGQQMTRMEDVESENAAMTVSRENNARNQETMATSLAEDAQNKGMMEISPVEDAEMAQTSQEKRTEAGNQSLPDGDMEAGESVINPWLLKFLDADSMEQKYQIVCDIKNDITDRLIDDLAVVVDVVIPEGKMGDRYEQLKYCIRTRQKYEKSSLWRE